MKKTTLLLQFLLITTCTVAAQKKVADFGEISNEELDMTSCSFEPDAPAIKLLDLQEAEFELMTYGTRLKIERRVRIKILNEKGYKYASISIPYLSKKWHGTIKELRGIVYNRDASGKIVTQKLEKSDFLKEKLVDNLGMVNFTFPGLKPGSVIEYSYTRIERNVIHLDPWVIQDEMPVDYTRNIVITPTESQVKEKVIGDRELTMKTDLLGSYNNRRKVTYDIEHIPSFRPEPYMSSHRDNLMRVVYLLFPRAYEFAGLTSNPARLWNSAGNIIFQSKFREIIEKPIAGTEKLVDSAKKIASIEERVSFIYDRVKNRNLHKAEQTLYAEDPTEAWNSRSGNSADLNMIMLNLLHHAKVKCSPLLVSTRDNGKVNKDFPSFAQLNGIDVMVFDSTETYILDASLRNHSIHTPPLNILNRDALLLIPDSAHWLHITDTRPLLKKSTSIFADLRQDGTMEGTATTLHYDYARTFKLDSTLDENDTRKNFFDKNTVGLKLLSVKQEAGLNDKEPFFESSDFTFELPQSNEFFFLNPQFLSDRTSNPFIQDKRVTDIDLGCQQEHVTAFELSLPETFEVEFLPKNIVLRAPDSSFFYKKIISSNKGSISMTEIFEVKRPLFSRDEYAGMQDFFKRMYALMNEEIVIRKKK